MTALDPLPFGAESVDELLAAYANGSLDPAARLEVERWLAVHPQWQPRLDAYRAIASAVRSSAGSSRAPSLDSLPGLWAGIDATPQPRPLRSAPPPPPPPPALHTGSGRAGPLRRSSSLPLALAAALIVAMAAASVVVLATRRTSDVAVIGVERAETQATVDEEPDSAAEAEAADDDEPTGAADPAPAAPAPAPATLAPPTEAPPPPATGGVDPDPRQALQDGAEATAEASTARTVLNAVGTLDLTGTSAAGVAGTDIVTVTIDGTGAIAFPDRSQLESTTIVEGGFLTSPPESTSEIEVDGRRWIRCDDQGAYVEQVEGGAEAVCSGLDLGADLAGPNATVDLLEESDDGTVELVGIESIDGVDTMHYRFTSSFDDETGSVPVTVDAWLGRDDDLLRQLTATTAIDLPLELFGESLSIPTTLVLTINLTDFGAPVTIEPPG